MKFRADIDEVIARHRAFYDSPEVGQALVYARVREPKPPARHPERFKFPAELYRYLDGVIDSYRAYWEALGHLPDDTIPTLHPYFGMAEFSAWLGGEVQFSEGTSYVHPCIHDWDDLDRLALDEHNMWQEMLIGGLRYISERAEDRFAVRTRGVLGPMDMANALRGNELFMDFLDEPEQVHALMRFCVRAGRWHYQRQMDAVGLFHGGTLTSMDLWMPGRAMGTVTEDASCMCSPDICREFSLPYLQQLVEGYDHVFLHTHAMGHHAMPAFLDIPNITCLQVSADPNCPKPIDIYKQLARSGAFKPGRIMQLGLSPREVSEQMPFLKEQKAVIVLYADTIEEANEAIRTIQNKLPIR